MNSFTSPQLVDFSEHIFYESGMLALSAIELEEIVRKLRGEQDATKKQNLDLRKNLTLESFLLHARSVYQFLAMKPARDDDICASNYISSYPVQMPTLNKADFYDLIGQKLMHLTYKRLSKDIWETKTIANELLNEFNKFLLEVSADLLDVYQLRMYQKIMQNYEEYNNLALQIINEKLLYGSEVMNISAATSISN